MGLNIERPGIFYTVNKPLIIPYLVVTKYKNNVKL